MSERGTKPPWLHEYIPVPVEVLEQAIEAMRKMADALARTYWTSDDGETRRDGTPEDEDADPLICEAWALILSASPALRSALQGEGAAK